MTEPAQSKRLSDADYERFYNESAVPTLTIDLRAREIVDCNDAALTFLGRPREQVLGRSGASLLSEPTPDEALRVRALRGDATRTIRRVDTARGVRTVEIHLVPTGEEGMAFVQANDLTDVLDANAVLERRTRELQLKTRALESVTGRVAHDLRGSLATIGGFVDLLLLQPDQFEEAQRHEILERVSANVKTLSQMIGGMLDEARSAEHAGDDGSSKVEDLFAVLRAVFDVDLLAISGHLETSTTVDHLPVPVAAVRQAVVNLIGNSIKFADSSRPLVVKLAADQGDDGWFTLTVEDNGRGFDGDPEELFLRGHRGERTDDVEGSGLGLSFTRSTIRDLGGTIAAEALDPGARFTIALPTGVVPSDPEHPAFGGTFSAGLTAFQLDRIFDVSPTPALILDLAARTIVRVNHAAVQVLDLPVEEIVGKRGNDFLVDPGAGDALRTELLLGEGVEHAETQTAIRTGAGVRAAEVNLTAVDDTTLAVVQFRILED